MPLLRRLEQAVTVQSQVSTLDPQHRFSESFATGSPAIMLQAIVGTARPGQTIQDGQVEQNVTHAVTQRGRPYAGAKPGDLLLVGGITLLVHGIEDPGLQGEHTIYWCEERRDL